MYDIWVSFVFTADFVYEHVNTSIVEISVVGFHPRWVIGSCLLTCLCYTVRMQM